MRILPLPAILLLLLVSCRSDEKIEKVIMISANAEWKVVREVFPEETTLHSPWGEYFLKTLPVGNSEETVVFIHGGWGKVAAAGSTQYCIDRWHPGYLINLGTCGGFEGVVQKYEVILVDQTVIYDITEMMGDYQQAIDDYSVSINLDWLRQPYPAPVFKTILVSGDRDINPAEIPNLYAHYHAVAGDWESGAIAYTCAKNDQRVLILRGVTDLVSQEKGEAYGDTIVYAQGTNTVMKKLLKDLPLWLERCR